MENRDVQGDASSRVEFATEHLASVSHFVSFRCWGPPRGTDNADAVNVVFYPEPHRMQASDLFKPGSGWERRLTEIFVAQTKAAFGANATRIMPPYDLSPEQFVAHEALQPSRWILSRQGLDLVVESYELGLGRGANPHAHASWSDLTPYLQPGLGLPST